MTTTFADLVTSFTAPPVPATERVINNADEPMPRGVYERKPKTDDSAPPVAKKTRRGRPKKGAQVDAMAATEKAVIDTGRHLAKLIREAVDVEEGTDLAFALDMFDLADNLYAVVRA